VGRLLLRFQYHLPFSAPADCRFYAALSSSASVVPGK